MKIGKILSPNFVSQVQINLANFNPQPGFRLIAYIIRVFYKNIYLLRRICKVRL